MFKCLLVFILYTLEMCVHVVLFFSQAHCENVCHVVQFVFGFFFFCKAHCTKSEFMSHGKLPVTQTWANTVKISATSFYLCFDGLALKRQHFIHWRQNVLVMK